MARIGFIPEIIEVKEHLAKLQEEKLVKTWELPYENLLTRRNAAIFYLTPRDESSLKKIWKELEQYKDFSYRENIENKLSDMRFRITFNEEEKLKNEELHNPKLEEVKNKDIISEVTPSKNGKMLTA